MGSFRVAMLVLIIACSPGIGSAQTEWVLNLENILDPGPPGSFDAGGGWPGAVVFDGSLYHLYYVGFPVENGPFFDGWQIGHATSTDGLAWIKDAANPVVALGSPGDWDETSLSKPAVAFDGSMFHMWYPGGDISFAATGYATSADGGAWTKYAGNPVLEPGSPGSWEGTAIAPKTVLFDGSTYRMWYYAGASVEESQIGFASSPDGVTWTKHPTPVVSPGRPGSWDSKGPHEPAVVFDGSRYHMWYTALNSAGSVLSIGYARSDDGVEWTKHVANPVVTHDNFAISSTVLLEDGVYRMWFAGLDGIHYATSTEDLFMSQRHFIPAAAYAPGVGEAFFETDVDASNADEVAATYRFLWLPRGVSNAEPLASDVFTLAPGANVRYSNVLSEIFELEPPALGGLAIEASSPRLLFMSRTYNIDRAATGGTFGQAITAVADDAMIGPGDRRRIVFGTEDAAFRTNIGCQNASLSPISVNVELLDQQGSSLSTLSLLLLPWSNDQLNRVFEDFSPVKGVVDVWSDLPYAYFYCYGSVLDTVTSDPTTVPPQE